MLQGEKCHWSWLLVLTTRTFVRAAVQVAGAVFDPDALAVFSPV